MIVHETPGSYMFTCIGHFKSDLFISFVSLATKIWRQNNAPISFIVTAWPSLRMWQQENNWTDFHEIWYYQFSLNSVDTFQFGLVSDSSNEHSTRRPTCGHRNPNSPRIIEVKNLSNWTYRVTVCQYWVHKITESALRVTWSVQWSVKNLRDRCKIPLWLYTIWTLLWINMAASRQC